MGWFDRKKHGPNEWTGFLEQGVKVEGKLEATGTFRIDSAMKGTVSSDDTLVLGEHASVEGTINGNFVMIAGRFDGIIRARGRVEIQPNAIVTGEIHCPCLVIEPGAIFDGQCHMIAPSEAAKSVTVTIPIRSAAGQTSR
jgi:cytoskeletal protein CcmA (bactofilin family)